MCDSYTYHTRGYTSIVWDVYTNGNVFPGLNVWDVHTNGNVFPGLTVWNVHKNGNVFLGLTVWNVHNKRKRLFGTDCVGCTYDWNRLGLYNRI